MKNSKRKKKKINKSILNTNENQKLENEEINVMEISNEIKINLKENEINEDYQKIDDKSSDRNEKEKQIEKGEFKIPKKEIEFQVIKLDEETFSIKSDIPSHIFQDIYKNKVNYYFFFWLIFLKKIIHSDVFKINKIKTLKK